MDVRNIGILTFLSMCVLLCVRAKPDCSETQNCHATTRQVCNGHGTCECGVCKCESPYKGPTCEECPTCPTSCELFKECVSCKIFDTGLLSFMECLNKCEDMANYLPVDPRDFDITVDADGLQLCRHVNEDRCVESFKIGAMTDGFRDLHVRTEKECPKTDFYEPKYEPTDEVVDVTDEVIVVEEDPDDDSGKAADSKVDKPESGSEAKNDENLKNGMADEHDMDMKVTEADDQGKSDKGTDTHEPEGAGAVSGDGKSGCSGLTASVGIMCLSVIVWCL